MTAAIYRYCSNPYGFPKLYGNARCEVLEFLDRWVKIRLLEFTRTHRPGDVLRVLRKNIHITGTAPALTARRTDMRNVRLPYKD